MTNIKRNTKKSKKDEKMLETPEQNSDNEQSEISINKQLEENALPNYKQYVRNTVREISESLKKL